MDTIQLKKLAKKHPIIKALLYPGIVARSSLKKIYQSHQQKAIDYLGSILIDDPVIRVDEFEGIFSIGPQSHLFSRIILNKYYEPDLVKTCLKYIDPDRDVIDVGANIGFFSVLFGQKIANKRVLAIEPTRNALQRLRRNIGLNGVANKVEVFEGVASNKRGVVQIKTINGKEEYSSLGEMCHPCIVNEKWISEEVVSVTLDELVEERSLDPGFLKVDAEGVEHLIFEGATKVLCHKRPIILSEISDVMLTSNGSSIQEVLAMLKGYEYDLFDPINPAIQPGTKKLLNIICFPKEMQIRFND